MAFRVGTATGNPPGVSKTRYYNTIKTAFSRYSTRSYTTSFYHIVFRTYRSEPTIATDHERELYAYLYGIAKNLHCQTYRIGGMPDHVHMLVSLPPSLPLAGFVQRLKTDSSKWCGLTAYPYSVIGLRKPKHNYLVFSR